MAKKFLWSNIDESDFRNENNSENVDIADYNLTNMTLFAANTNLWRHIIRLSDSLKPIERRVLYTLYLKGLSNLEKNKKSTEAVGSLLKYHSHGDKGAYDVIVGMAQPWKKQCPIIRGKGNFGNSWDSTIFASSRYTELAMSKYAVECFFSDYDSDCVEMVFNSSADADEPMSLPAKFPNILVNGGMGIAFGNSFRIPPYNINDIIKICKNVIDDPENAEVFMIPDLPSGCEIIDNGESFREIIDTGKGVLKMRATANIQDRGRYWGIEFTSLPWMVNITGIHDKIALLAKEGKLPIKDIQDNSQAIKPSGNELPFAISYTVLIDKNHDPKTVLEKLYNLTELQKSVSIDFKAVTDDLSIARFSMQELINSWINERRSYKRRLFNKKLNKISARIDLLEILLYLLKKDNIETTMNIIKNSNSDEIVTKLMKHGKMSSYQATKIADMKLSAFSKDAKARYGEELAKIRIEKDNIMDTIVSEKKIDAIIKSELDDLAKYGKPRASKIVKESTGKYVADANYNILITNDNFIKKLAIPTRNGSAYQMGAFKTNDYPLHFLNVHNANNVTLYDTMGKYTTIPVNDIDVLDNSNIGHRVFDITQLSGKIVTITEEFDTAYLDKIEKKYGIPYVVFITKRGYAKKTPLREFATGKNSKNLRAIKIREDDALVDTKILFNNNTVVLYSRNGVYTVLKVEDIADQAKQSMGLISCKLDSDDELRGITVVGSMDTDIVVITDKGVCKKIGTRYIGEPTRRNSIKDQGSLITLDSSDKVSHVIGANDNNIIQVVIRNSLIELATKDIPELSKKAKGKKLCSTNGNNIIMVRVKDKE